MKKLLSFFLSGLLIACMMPASVFAANDSWQPIKTEIYNAMKNGNASLDVQKYSIPTSDIDTLAQDIRDSYPDLFYADISTYTYVGGRVYALQFQYNDLNNKESRDKYEAAVKKALESVNEKMSDIEKALALHDYLTKNVKFEENGAYVHSAYGALVQKSAVCDGYSKAYQELLSRCGISALLIRSITMGHAWNQVKINGNWYNVDVTWDDPSPDIANHTEYTYFMLSDAVFQKKEHSGWTSTVKCTNTSYDNSYNWNSIAKKMPVRSATFNDIYSSDYYSDAVEWAYKSGITTGVSDTVFGASNTCTRAQAVTFIWRANGKPEPNTNINPYADVNETDYYYKAVLWAVEQGITNGIADNQFGPDLKCLYEHIITFLWRAKGSPNSSSSRAAEFDDKYYQAAAAWGFNKSMFKAADEVFIPENECPRADIVYYMYLSR